MIAQAKVNNKKPPNVTGEFDVEVLLLRVAEAAKVLGLGRAKVYELISSGDLPSVRIGRAVRVPAHELQEWVRSQLTNRSEGEE